MNPEQLSILTAPQFTRWDVSAVAGVSEGQLLGLFNRKQVVLDAAHNPGSGRRRLFTGADILKVLVAVSLSALGYPLDGVRAVADVVAEHARDRLSGRVGDRRLVLASYALPNGSFQLVPIWEGMENEPELPPFVILVQADVVIDMVLARLRSLVEEAPGPTGPLRYLPGWTSDSTLAGLTKEETAEVQALAEQATNAGRNPHKHPRYRELWDKYNKAALELFAEQPRGPAVSPASTPNGQAASPPKGTRK